MKGKNEQRNGKRMFLTKAVNVFGSTEQKSRNMLREKKKFLYPICNVFWVLKQRRRWSKCSFGNSMLIRKGESDRSRNH